MRTICTALAAACLPFFGSPALAAPAAEVLWVRGDQPACADSPPPILLEQGLRPWRPAATAEVHVLGPAAGMPGYLRLQLGADLFGVINQKLMPGLGRAVTEGQHLAQCMTLEAPEAFEATRQALQQAAAARIAATLALRSPAIGMTPEEVLAGRWGEPLRVNSTTTKRGVREQWVYASGAYLYFRNGRLETIQQ